MSRRYYHQPPTVKQDVPAYIAQHYGVTEHVEKMIKWARYEYELALFTLSQRASPKTIQFFLNEYSAVRVLAESEGFQEMVKNISERDYNKLSFRDRVFLRRAWELFQILSR